MPPSRAGRPRTRILVEEAHPVTTRDVLRPEARANVEAFSVVIAFDSGSTWARRLADLVACEERSVPWSPAPARVWILRCPGCGARRRALYYLHQRMACRVCHGLRYQSWSGRWDYALMERLRVPCERLEHAPGPKGRRYRTALRRRGRVVWLWATWFTAWTKRWREEAEEILGPERAKAFVARARRRGH